MFAYDPSLLAAVETTPRSVEDVVAILQAIDAACADGDGLKWFNWLYLRVTQAVQSRVNSAGLDDSAWIAALDVQFAISSLPRFVPHSAARQRPDAGRLCSIGETRLQSHAFS